MEFPAASRVPPPDSALPVAGELIIENGPQRGLRRALVGPLTVIGQAEWCDLRIEADGVSPWHCVVARGERGLVLRDLHSDTGTRVNGQPITTFTLKDGDLFAVGPLELRVRWSGKPAESSEEQQHHARLLEEVRRERAALAQERGRFEERVGQVHQELARDRLAMAERHKVMRKQGQRLRQLRGRAKGRRAAELSRLQAREALLTKTQDELEAGRTALRDERLRCNGDVELGRRELQAAREAFRQEQAARDSAARVRASALQAREHAVAQAERDLARQAEQSAKDLESRRQELAGLEQRVQNYRQKLFELEQQAARLEAHNAGPLAPQTTVAPLPATEEHTRVPEYGQGDADLDERLTALEAVAEELADQRLNLAEQSERLAHAREEWRRERGAVVADLEALAVGLGEREQAVVLQEQAAATLQEEARNKRAEVERLRRQVEAQRARHRAQAAAWEGERDRLSAQLRFREEQAESVLQGLSAVRERWQVLCQKELEHLRAQREKGGAYADDLLRRLHQREQDVAAREGDLVRRQTAWEHLQAVVETENARLRRHAESFDRQCDRYARQTRELQEEVDHLARLLLDDAPAELPRLVQAA